MDVIKPNGVIGRPTSRIDGLAKVTGTARYGADHVPQKPLYAYLATSAIARGHIRTINEQAARAIPGVKDILTYKNIGADIKPGKYFMQNGYMASAKSPYGSNEIYFAGQLIAAVIADTFENACAGALAIKVVYDELKPSATFGTEGSKAVEAKSFSETSLKAGDFIKAFEKAPAKIDVKYETSAQHHNPLELFQATCAWDGDYLTVWESTQNARAIQYGLAEQLDLKPDHIRVLSPFVGGAFGSRGQVAYSTALIALAARRLGCPVKLVASRQQGFTLRTFRAETQHHIQLAADANGHLQALSHESWELTSRTDRFAQAGSDDTARLYQCPNIKTQVHNVEADRQTPGFMRAPPEMPYLFAMESAMDELAYQLKLDPIEFRRRNDTMIEPIKQLPYTSRALMPCFDRGAKDFGWSKRKAEPGSIQEGEWLVGFGCASAFYPAKIGPASCRVTLFKDGRAKAEIGTHDIGNGTYTIIAQTVADRLGIPLNGIEVLLGDSQLPAAPLTAGSNSTASVCNVIAMACDKIHTKLAHAVSKEKYGWLHLVNAKDWKVENGSIVDGKGQGLPLETAVMHADKSGAIVVEESNNPHGAPLLIGPKLIDKGKAVIVGGVMKDRMQFAFGAQFVEVRVHSLTGEIRVPRVLGVFAAGRIINPTTARSQLLGGQIWGVANAIQEATEIDKGTARYVNADLAEYHLAVNADVGDYTVTMLPEEDEKINPLGIKGVGELGATGMNAAVANAVFNATGARIRKLPIQLDALLPAVIARV